MTIRQVAKIAGVSTATVSRVLNSAPYISDSTAEAVHRAIAETQYKPTKRRRSNSKIAGASPVDLRVGFFIVEYNPSSHNPAYERLFRGVADAAKEFNLDLKFGFIKTSEGNVVQQLKSGGFDGLILHGLPPSDEDSASLHTTPTVWLMGGRKRPTWGDQIMPDNDSIGRIAANYLTGLGHRDVMYFGIDSAWFYQARAASFERAIHEAGARVSKMLHIQQSEIFDRAAAAKELIDTWKSLPERPTGLFVAEDWLLGPVYSTAAEAGVRIGTDLTIVSCNNDRVRLEGLTPMPATIDVHFDRTAYRGVQLLAYRLNSKSFEDRIRVLVEPTLVLP